MIEFATILRRNLITPVVLAIITLAAILLFLGESRDAWFISIVIVLNVIIAVIQEVRARRALHKLELMSAPHARRMLADGQYEDIAYDRLAVEDTIEIRSGDEVPADVVVIKSRGLECDESMLTGEVIPIDKPKGSRVYAGTTITAGAAVALVVAVGVDTKAGGMASTLKRYKPILTPLQKKISRAITVLTFGAVVLAAIIFATYAMSGQDAVQIFKTITSASVTVIPEGLLLASSLMLAFGSLKLAEAKVLPQKLSAIEAMALLDTLAVDKTGTLTSPEIHFEHMDHFSPKAKSPIYMEMLGILASETSASNATGRAIIEATPNPKAYATEQILAFSSTRKMSGIRLMYRGQSYGIVMGAPEVVGKYCVLTDMQRNRIETESASGNRVLVAALLKDSAQNLKSLDNESCEALGMLVFRNSLRDGVVETVSYLQNNGVQIRVISGDNPQTVSYIAKRAGIADSDKTITGVELARLDKEGWQAAISDRVIFARVLPEQKEQLVSAFQQRGMFTGMVGDGVNDALALKQADLGIAMYAGAVASRRVADIVLLNNSFTSLPLGMRLGDRIMLAIEIIASLFFHKIIFTIIVLVSTLILGVVHPFEPRHITFMNIFLVTMPTLLLAAFPPRPERRIQPRYFWRDTVTSVVSIGVLSGSLVAFVYWYLGNLYIYDASGVVTTTVIVATLMGAYFVFLAPIILNATYERSVWQVRLIYMIAVAVVASVSFGFDLSREFFDFSRPAWAANWGLAVLIGVVMALQWFIAARAGNRIKERSGRLN